MKSYNVSLANDSCVFDSRREISTAEEAANFAADRGSKYRVYVDAGDDENTITATYYTGSDTFAVDLGYDFVFMTRTQFARYLAKVL